MHVCDTLGTELHSFLPNSLFGIRRILRCSFGATARKHYGQSGHSARYQVRPLTDRQERQGQGQGHRKKDCVSKLYQDLLYLQNIYYSSSNDGLHLLMMIAFSN